MFQRLDLHDKGLPASSTPSLPRARWVASYGQVDISPLQRAIHYHGAGLWECAVHGCSNVFLKRAFHDRIGVNKAIFCFCDDLFTTVYRLPWWQSWRSVLLPIFHQLHVRPESVVRCLLARLPPGAGIPVHHDTGRWCTRSHRVHIPVFTSTQSAHSKLHAQVQFSVGQSTARMNQVAFYQGAAIELNNRAKHAVHNHWSRHRVHLIFDWVELNNSDAAIGIPWIKYVHVRPGDDILQTRRSISLRRRCAPACDRRACSRSKRVLTEPTNQPMSRSDVARCTVAIRTLAKTCVGLRRAKYFEVSCRQFVLGEIGVNFFLLHLRQTFGARIDEAMVQWRLADLVSDAERAASLRRAYALFSAPEAPCWSVCDTLQGQGSHQQGQSTMSSDTISPTFVVIGGQKCGTTSVYEYLNQHPDLARCKAKEPHFFDWCWESVRTTHGGNAAVEWKDKVGVRYMSAFNVVNSRKENYFTGEATPSYLLGGATVARRLHTAAPCVKLVVCLRDPVDRAYSHYKMTEDKGGTPSQRKRRGTVAGKVFPELADDDIALLASWTDTCEDRWCTDTEFEDEYLGKMPIGHGSHSYLGRGIYAPQLRLWLRVFPRDRVFFLWTSSLRTSVGVQCEMTNLFGFIGMPSCGLTDTSRKNARKYKAMVTPLRQKLASFYGPHNKALFELMSSGFALGKSRRGQFLITPNRFD